MTVLRATALAAEAPAVQHGQAVSGVGGDLLQHRHLGRRQHQIGPARPRLDARFLQDSVEISFHRTRRSAKARRQHHRGLETH